MTNLDDLWLYESEMTGTIPTQVTGLTNLSTLLLNGNQFTGEIPEELVELQNLTKLHLAENQIVELGRLVTIQVLEVPVQSLFGQVSKRAVARIRERFF